MKINNKTKSAPVYTHGGSPAVRNKNALMELRRSVCSCFLWEDTFYESGEDIATRITKCCNAVSDADVANLAIECRSVHNLRHVPLLLLVNLIKKGGNLVAPTIGEVIQRPDELSELVAIYWKMNPGKKMLPRQMKKGLELAFQKFDEYSLGKYNADRDVKLRDVLFLCHAKPKDTEQAELWRKLANNELKSPDTWEKLLSGGADKKTTFENLIREGKLGYFALIRNLRNMQQSGVDTDLMKNAILAKGKGFERILPFRFVAAARHCPMMEPHLDKVLCDCINNLKPLSGKTVVLVDCSGSMYSPLSGKSDIQAIDAAATLASIINGDLRVFAFADNIVEVPPRKGMSGVDAIKKATSGGTNLSGAVKYINENVAYDRLIVITDEQDTTGQRVPAPKSKGYMINVASYENGVGYGDWTRINGFSENVLRWIHEYESYNF